MADSVKKGARITGADRSKLAGELKKKYTQAVEHPSPGGGDGPLVRLRAPDPDGERGPLRGRGGATRGKAKR